MSIINVSNFARYDKRLCIFELAHHHDDGRDSKKKEMFKLIFE